MDKEEQKIIEKGERQKQRNEKLQARLKELEEENAKLEAEIRAKEKQEFCGSCKQKVHWLLYDYDIMTCANCAPEKRAIAERRRKVEKLIDILLVEYGGEL